MTLVELISKIDIGNNVLIEEYLGEEITGLDTKPLYEEIYKGKLGEIKHKDIYSFYNYEVDYIDMDLMEVDDFPIRCIKITISG